MGQKSRRFSLIELMAVVVIMAILMVIAFPAFQDYPARSQVGEGFSLSADAKEAVAVYSGDHGIYAHDNAPCDMAPPTSISGGYVRSVSLGGAGSISVISSSTTSAKISGQALTLTAAMSGAHCAGSAGRGGKRRMPAIQLPLRSAAPYRARWPKLEHHIG